MRGDRDRPKMHRFSCVDHVKFCDRSLCQQNLEHDSFERGMSRRLKEANAALLEARGYTCPLRPTVCEPSAPFISPVLCQFIRHHALVAHILQENSRSLIDRHLKWCEDRSSSFYGVSLLHDPDKDVTMLKTFAYPHRLSQAVTAALLWGIALVGCGDFSPGECTFDSECGVGSRCIQQSCYEECTTDEECASASRTCQAVDRGGETAQSITVCAGGSEFISPNTSPGDTMCEEDEVCQQAFLDDRARCSLLGSCIIPAEKHAILITDRSMRGQPGAELFLVQLEPPSSQSTEEVLTLAVESYEPLEPLLSEVPEGWNLPADLSDTMQMCVTDPQERPTLPLGGNGGQVRLVAQDAKGARQLLSRGWRVVVIERGTACVDTEFDDPIDVSLCVSLDGDALDNDTQCDRMLVTQGEGRTIATISFDSSM